MDKRFLILAAIAALILVRSARASGALETFYDPEDQTGSIIDQLPDFGDIGNFASDAFSEIDMAQADRNLQAVLWAIRRAEGTATNNDEGYRALFGWRPGNGKTFSDMSQHPRQFFQYTDLSGVTRRTSASGAYQITATTYDALNRKYPGRFDGFTPTAQDAMAEALIEERGAMADIAAGRLERAISKIRPIWASLPGAGVNQPERSLAYITQAYIDAGGVLA